jgi:uncharacterized membrane protein (DUF485 family)
MTKPTSMTKIMTTMMLTMLMVIKCMVFFAKEDYFATPCHSASSSSSAFAFA